MAAEDRRGQEIAALLNEIKLRVRARYPAGSVPVDYGGPEPVRIPLPDLLPLVHARDAAQAKVASIGSVNPRAGGVLNSLVQRVKRMVARGMGWFVRDQVTFNREVMTCVEAVMEALNDVNLSLSTMASHFNLRLTELARVADEARRIEDVEQHWNLWRVEWERNLERTEIATLRGIADLQKTLTALEDRFRESLRLQHSDYQRSLQEANVHLQDRFWAELAKVRQEYEQVIHAELRLVRQRMQFPSPASASQEQRQPERFRGSLSGFDYQRFADRFRGPEEYVRRNQQEFYLSRFAGLSDVLDIGCGRGEFLEALRDRGIEAQGIELSDECVAYCRGKGLHAEKADLFYYLASTPESSFDAIFSSQVVEHIDPARLPEMIRLCATRLRRGGLLALETPNPECLAIFASHFYLDPTHFRPVPSALLSFYMEEFGLGSIEVHPLSPAVESFPEIRELPAAFAARFFGGLDYAIFARKL